MKKAVPLLTFSKDIRQGDVLLRRVESMPADVKPADGQERKIILAWGEVTGHHHRIEDHPGTRLSEAEALIDAYGSPEAAAEIAEAAIARAKARLWVAPSGERFLTVDEPVTLKHEEHTAHVIAPGIYQLPVQVEYTPAALRRVAD